MVEPGERERSRRPKKPRLRRIEYEEGSLFALPLERGGFGVGVVARTLPDRCVFLTHLFGPKRDTVPTRDEIGEPLARDAVLVLRTGDLSLVDGSWPLLGKLRTWDREEWPIPHFYRIDPLRDRAWEVELSDSNILETLSEVEVGYDLARRGERASICGAGATEIRLTQILDPEP